MLSRKGNRALCKDKRLEVWESFEAERLFEEAILMHF
jgi:hypothetical protein